MPACFAALNADLTKQPPRTISYEDMLHWGVGLLIVLAIFFLCVWALCKINGTTVRDTEKMHIVGGLSLGIREKVILLQVGKKQLILGVTPGHIDTLHILEGDDCLGCNESVPIDKDNGFAGIVSQLMKRRSSV